MVRGSVVELQVARRQMENLGKTWWPTVTASIIGNNSRLRGSSDWAQYRWDCGTDPETERTVTCRDLCVVSWISADDLLTLRADLLTDPEAPPRR